MKHDIHIRKVNGEESVWISQRLLVSDIEISEIYIRKSRSLYKNTVRACDIRKQTSFLPDSGKAWRWGFLNDDFYYCLDNIPNHAPNYYRDRLGDADALVAAWQQQCRQAEETNLEKRLKEYIKAVKDNYIPFYIEENPVQREGLIKACSVLDFMLEIKDEYPATSNKMYRDIGNLLKAWQMPYIPHNPIRLKEKFTEITPTSPICELIYLPRKGNTNAELYNDKEVYSWVMQLRAMDANFSNEHIIRKVSEMCALTGKRQPSKRWYGMKIFEQPETQYLTGGLRYGSGSSKATIYKGYLPKINALYAGDCWEIDATRYNTIAHEVEVIDKRTGEVKTVEKFMMVVAVRDVHSGDVLGYSFTHAENHLAYLQALKMAVQTTGYLPYEIVTDRFPGHNTEQVQNFFERLKALGVKVDISHNPNQKARLERWFRTLQNVFAMDSKYFYGDGIRSTVPSAHRSAEYLARVKKEAKKEGWNFDKAAENAAEYIERYRVTPLSNYSRQHAKIDQSPAELHDESMKPHVIQADERRISMLFDVQKTLKLRHEGLFMTEIVGVKHYFQIPVEAHSIISNYFNQEVVISYSFDNMDKAFVWEKRGSLLLFLSEAERVKGAQLYGPEKDLDLVAKHQARSRAIQKQKDELLQEKIGEESALMGVFTDKKRLNAFEDEYLKEPKPMKKASGAEYEPETLDEIVLKNLRNEY